MTSSTYFFIELAVLLKVSQSDSRQVSVCPLQGKAGWEECKKLGFRFRAMEIIVQFLLLPMLSPSCAGIEMVDDCFSSCLVWGLL